MKPGEGRSGVTRKTTAVMQELRKALQREGRAQLLESEVYRLLATLGLTVPRHFTWRPGEAVVHPGSDAAPAGTLAEALDALPGERVVLKIQSPGILHKTEAGGITVCSRDPEDVRRTGGELWRRVGTQRPGAELDGILVVEQVDYEDALGHELLVGWRRDRAFGPVLFVGPGGVMTEWFHEVAAGGSLAVFPAEPFDKEKVRSAVLNHPALRVAVAPSRRHAKAPVALNDLMRALQALAGLSGAADAASGGENVLDEIEINPLVAAQDGRLVPLDGVGRFGGRSLPAPERPVSKVRHLLYPDSAAVIGASARGMNPGRIILRNLKAGEGIRYGHLYAVHPKEEAIDGIPCRPDLKALPEKVDLAVVSVPAQGAVDAIRTLAADDLAESIILIPGGFEERGRGDLAGAIVEALRASRSQPSGGPVMIGANCLGIVSRGRYNTFFLPEYKLPFHGGRGENLAVISQSGAYLVTFSSNLEGIIYPKANISYGNEMDLTAADILEYYTRHEPDVRILACYIEGFQAGDGRRFLTLARELRRDGRVLIVFKAGKTDLGARAAQSHTASMAGDYGTARALLAGEGVAVAETLDQFEDTVKVFCMLDGRRPAGRRVGVISNAGFECSTVMDHLYDLEAAEFSQKTVERIAKLLPEIAHARNPIDATPMATTEAFLGAVEAMLEDDGVDALIVSAVPVTPALDNLAPDPIADHPENIYGPGSFPQGLIPLFRRTSKPLVAVVDSGRLYDPLVILLQKAGIPVYRKIDRAGRALACFCRHAGAAT
ncbi:MAG: hypothetical protein GF355_12400 [Candidatus Eisenbacteria bacterium]|nr:hypothetical protein [Candidatus Eisenbacteria bacterium]